MAAMARVAASRTRGASSSLWAPARAGIARRATITPNNCFFMEQIFYSGSTHMKHALVTGGAGFIGSHLVDSLLADGWRVTAFDNFDPFYDPVIKEGNVAAHRKNPSYELVRGD